MQLVNIGFGNVVSANKIVSIVSPEAAPIKRLVQEAKSSFNNGFWACYSFCSTTRNNSSKIR